MAQLRDKQTSELLAEGTPAELALAADKLGLGRVIFDGVGEDFSPKAAIKAHRDEVAGMEAAAAEAAAKAADKDDPTTSEDAARVKAAHAELKEVETKTAGKVAASAEKAIAAAHERVQERLRADGKA